MKLHVQGYALLKTKVTYGQIFSSSSVKFHHLSFLVIPSLLILPFVADTVLLTTGCTHAWPSYLQPLARDYSACIFAKVITEAYTSFSCIFYSSCCNVAENRLWVHRITDSRASRLKPGSGCWEFELEIIGLQGRCSLPLVFYSTLHHFAWCCFPRSQL